MTPLEIYLYGSPILSEKTKPFQELPERFSEFLNRMYATMYTDDGIGLSANQVGIDRKFFIADFSLHDRNLEKGVFINPEILESDGEELQEEGCLSLPEIRVIVPRATNIKIRYENPDRQVIEQEYSGYPARVIQHEVDHLSGVYITDHISPLKRSFLAAKLRKIAEKGQSQTEVVTP